MMKLINSILCWLNGVDEDELDKLAQAKHRDMPWSDWAKKISKR